jgi:hypothetical protein
MIYIIFINYLLATNDVTGLTDTVGGKVSSLSSTPDITFMIGQSSFRLVCRANIKCVTQCKLDSVHHPHIFAGKMLVKGEVSIRDVNIYWLFILNFCFVVAYINVRICLDSLVLVYLNVYF